MSWSEGVLADLVGAMMGHVHLACVHEHFFFISIGIRVTLDQSECIVSVRSSK